jgi:hypothetical protein
MLLDIMKQDHPRITEDYLNMLIDESDAAVTKIGEKTTVVQLVLPSGFAITEHSSCVDPANYDETLGVKYAMDRIKTKLWELEGYRLQCALHWRRSHG